MINSQDNLIRHNPVKTGITKIIPEKIDNCKYYHSRIPTENAQNSRDRFFIMMIFPHLTSGQI